MCECCKYEGEKPYICSECCKTMRLLYDLMLGNTSTALSRVGAGYYRPASCIVKLGCVKDSIAREAAGHRLRQEVMSRWRDASVSQTSSRRQIRYSLGAPHSAADIVVELVE